MKPVRSPREVFSQDRTGAGRMTLRIRVSEAKNASVEMAESLSERGKTGAGSC
jgi:hypothetical protein